MNFKLCTFLLFFYKKNITHQNYQIDVKLINKHYNMYEWLYKQKIAHII